MMTTILAGPRRRTQWVAPCLSTRVTDSQDALERVIAGAGLVRRVFLSHEGVAHALLQSLQAGLFLQLQLCSHLVGEQGERGG
jgi:hypothetical protein